MRRILIADPGAPLVREPLSSDARESPPHKRLKSSGGGPTNGRSSQGRSIRVPAARHLSTRSIRASSPSNRRCQDSHDPQAGHCRQVEPFVDADERATGRQHARLRQPLTQSRRRSGRRTGVALIRQAVEARVLAPSPCRGACKLVAAIRSERTCAQGGAGSRRGRAARVRLGAMPQMVRQVDAEGRRPSFPARRSSWRRRG